jgi:tetratricopeptide (TPR) repeat protein
MNDWFEAEQRVERAQQLSESHRWEEALTEIEAALDINPNNASWHAQHGFLLDELGRTGDAVDAYERSIALEAGDEDIGMALGEALTRLGRFARALEVLDDLARQNPSFEPAYCHRIAVYTELGRHDQAEEMFYLAQDLAPECPHCFFNIGVSLAARGQMPRALYCWQRVLELDPSYEGVRLRIAQAFRAQGKLEEAQEFLLAERREAPGNTDLLYELAELAIEAEDFSAAETRYSEIIELTPEDIDAHFARGQLLLRMDEPAPALGCFQQVLTLSNPPPIHDFDRSLGEANLRLGRLDKARQCLSRAAQNNPSDIASHMLLGDCLMAMERCGEAADEFRRALSIDTGNAPAHFHLAVCLFREGRCDDGLRHCLDALRHDPGYAPPMHRAILAYLHLGRWADARQMLRRALRHQPDDRTLAEIAGGVWRFRLQFYVRQMVGGARRLLATLTGRS